MIDQFGVAGPLSDNDLVLAEYFGRIGADCVEADEQGISTQRFWDFDFAEPQTFHSRADYGDELDYLFDQAVRRQLIPDVPVGGFLTAGIDSAVIAAVGAAQTKTFYICETRHQLIGTFCKAKEAGLRRFKDKWGGREISVPAFSLSRQPGYIRAALWLRGRTGLV